MFKNEQNTAKNVFKDTTFSKTSQLCQKNNKKTLKFDFPQEFSFIWDPSWPWGCESKEINVLKVI